jgi:hypothetical protein
MTFPLVVLCHWQGIAIDKATPLAKHRHRQGSAIGKAPPLTTPMAHLSGRPLLA